jgi:hypothetical protein
MDSHPDTTGQNGAERADNPPERPSITGRPLKAFS